MQKNEVIAWFGSQQKLATFLGVAQSNVSAWKKIPVRHQRAIEDHTDGELIAERGCEQKFRYTCAIEEKYINIIKTEAKRLNISGVEVLRRALKFYQKRNERG
jgi:hypothetical protein